jgi:uncharacterized protein YvpB
VNLLKSILSLLTIFAGILFFSTVLLALMGLGWNALLTLNPVLMEEMPIAGSALGEVLDQADEIAQLSAPEPTATIPLIPTLPPSTATASQTPYQPAPVTPTPSPTPTHTATFTPSPTPTHTATFTPTNTPSPTLTFTPAPTWTSSPLPPTQPAPTDPPQPIWPPEEAFVSGVPGHGMHYRLDCETRSAVDLAGFFGVGIDHETFLHSLPYTDDPETGYVGYYDDPAGSIPPNSYGVHAPPVASLLRAYGLNAVDWKWMSFERLQEEIASGRPAMVWVIGGVVNGTPVSYTAASTGNTTTVAAYEHTVLLVGYDPDYVYIQDGYKSYSRTHGQFLNSWGVLGNMAVTINP